MIAEPHPSEVTALVQRNVLCLALCWTSAPQKLYKAVGLEWLSWMRFDEDLTWTNIVGSDFGSKNAWREGGWSSRTVSLNDKIAFLHKSMCQVLPQHSSPCKSIETTADRLASLWHQQQMSATLSECLEILKEHRNEVSPKDFLPTIPSATWQVQKQVRESGIWAHWSVWVLFLSEREFKAEMSRHFQYLWAPMWITNLLVNQPLSRLD